MIQGKLLSYGDDLTDSNRIRKQVLVDELGMISIDQVYENNNESIHVIVYEEDNSSIAVAAGRIRYDGEKCIIDQIAVIKDYRGKKYGDFTVRMLMNKAFTSGISEVRLYAPENVSEFFKKIGFDFVKNYDILSNNEYENMHILQNNVIISCHFAKKMK
jgi:N-acetylglutamate synthase-like GNAT family acetyltransferase